MGLSFTTICGGVVDHQQELTAWDKNKHEWMNEGIYKHYLNVASALSVATADGRRSNAGARTKRDLTGTDFVGDDAM